MRSDWLPKPAVSCLSALVLLIIASISYPLPSSLTIAQAPLSITEDSQSLEEEKEIEKLRIQALSKDRRKSSHALESLRSRGTPAQAVLQQVLHTLLRRNEKEITKAKNLIGNSKRRIDEEEKFQAHQKRARENIGKLTPGKLITHAKKDFKSLHRTSKRMEPVRTAWGRISDAIKLRAPLFSMWNEVAAEEDKQSQEESEQALRAKAEASLGMKWDKVFSIPPIDGCLPPDNPVRRCIWLSKSCKAINAYNREMKSHMSRQEYENVDRVNLYREALGLLPLEIDARLVQSARRHSKEMADHNYFSHTSPTPGLETFVNRINKTGYDAPLAENIAKRPGSGEDLFWVWFSSPKHHQNMADPMATAIGVGCWPVRGSSSAKRGLRLKRKRWHMWTQNFGCDTRLMLATDRDKGEVGIKGKILPPRR